MLRPSLPLWERAGVRAGATPPLHMVERGPGGEARGVRPGPTTHRYQSGSVSASATTPPSASRGRGNPVT